MTTSNRTILSAILVSSLAGLGALAGCATDPASAATNDDQPAAQQQSVLVPTVVPALSLDGAKPNAVINDCACLDFSQICDCRSGTCYGYVANGQDGPYACYEGSTFLYNYYCTHYDRVTGC